VKASILDSIARWAQRYRNSRTDARGLALMPEQVGDVTAAAGHEAWLCCRLDPHIWGAMVHQPEGKTMFDKMIYGGVEIVEDGDVPLNAVVFKIDGKEVGRITDCQNASQNGGPDGLTRSA
jgi:hypothetical protein